MRAGIAGAGILGGLLAQALVDAGWEVTVFAAGIACSSAAAGLLTPISELDRANLLIFQLGQDSIKKYWPAILQQLEGPIDFKQNGSLVLYHPHDHAEWLLFNRRIASQLADYSGYQQLTAEDLLKLEPELSQFQTGGYFAEEAHIDCQTLMVKLFEYLHRRGVICHDHLPVLSLTPKTLTTAHNLYQFDYVFDCRGLGAKNSLPDLRGVRGELIWLHAPAVQLSRPIRLLHPRYSLYIVPRPGKVYLIGTSEIEAEDYTPISVRTTLELLTAAYFVHEGFSEARLIKTVTQCRPTLSHHQPRIQASPGLIAMNGLYRHGFLLAPALVQDVLRYLHQQELCYPKIWENVHDPRLFK